MLLPYSCYHTAKATSRLVAGSLLVALLANAPGSYSQTIIPSSIVVAPPVVPVSAIHDETATTYASSSPLNWVRTYTPQAPLTDATRVVAYPGYPEVGLGTQYLDGLGRPLQSVSRGATSTGRDLVAPVVYDEFGRESYQYLPYASAADGDGGFKTAPFAEQKAFMQAQYPGEQVYYSRTLYEASPLGRVEKSMAAGNSWAGQNKGVALGYEVNEPGEVRMWNISTANASTPTTSGYYDGANGTNGAQLYRSVTTDESGNRMVEYKDKEGQVVLKKAEISSKADIASHTGWLCTYYVYDDLNNLRFVIPPKAVQQIIVANWQLSTVIISELCFYYEYDQRKRMILKKVPGAGEVRMVYDARDRLVMSQDAKMREAMQWMYTQYDELNRPTATGLLTDAVHYSNAAFHQVAAYNSISYPDLTAFTNIVDLTHTYYDNYSWTSGSGLPSSFSSDQANESEFLSPSFSVFPYAQKVSATTASVQGLVTGYKTRVLGSSTYLYGVTFYDDQHRPVQMQSTNVTGGKDMVTNQYSFDGKVLVSKLVQRVGSTPDQQYTVVTRNEYDKAGRLINTYKNINNTGEKLLAVSAYDELGKPITKKLGYKVVQGVDKSLETLTYDYNIRGWLTGINKGYAQGQVATTANWFGMQLNYDYGFTVASGGTDGNGGMVTSSVTTVPVSPSYGNYGGESRYKATRDITFDAEFYSGEKAEFVADIVPQQIMKTETGCYNGNIAGTVWKSRGDAERRAYGFSYDAANRLMKADFSQYTNGGWNRQEKVDFSMKMGDGEVPGLAYDAGGNIMAMKQWGLKPGGSVQVDDLHYDYILEGNKLKSVADNIPYVQGSASMGDFLDKNKKMDNENDYGYDVNGNLVTDLNKKMGAASATGEDVASGGAIQYNYLNLPALVTIRSEDGTAIRGTISYVYDAAGNKLQKVVVENAGSGNGNIAATTTTTYLGAGVYESKWYSVTDASHQGYSNQLQYLAHEEGRARPSRDAATQAITGYIYDYFIKDHLGNVRMMLTEEQKLDAYPTLSFEGNSSQLADQQAVWQDKSNQPLQVNTVRTPRPGGFGDAAGNGDYAMALQKSTTGAIGATKLLKVMSGDRIHTSVEYFYQGTNVDNSQANNAIAGLVVSLGSVLSAGSPVAGVLKDAGSSVAGALGANTVLAGMLNTQAGTSGNNQGPKAYLNILLFDEQFRFDQDHSVVVAIAYQPNLKGIIDRRMSQAIEVAKNGYAYVYFSNESNEMVYFDNFMLTHERGPLLEETHYYPFGLTMAGISSKAAGGTENKRGFNGGNELQNKEFSDGSGLELYDATHRMYDPQLGRFGQIDEFGEVSDDLSPYNFSSNNPILRNDPLGLKDTVVNGEHGSTSATLQPVYVSARHTERVLQNTYWDLVNRGVSFDRVKDKGLRNWLYSNDRMQQFLARLHDDIRTQGIIATEVASSFIPLGEIAQVRRLTFLLKLFKFRRGVQAATEIESSIFSYITSKIAKQMARRGWTKELIHEVVNSPFATSVAAK